MRSVRATYVLNACIALCWSSAMYAQVRLPAPEPPPGVTIRWQDRLTEQEESDANPCFRRRTDSGKDIEDWWRTAWIVLCVERTRSQAVTHAWENGMDEHGVPLNAEKRARKRAEMEAWLRRLAGKYRIEGKYWNIGGNSPVHGSADCFGIGGGPGVSCMISAEWIAPKATYKDKGFDNGLYSAMKGLVLVFGIDPGASQVRVTLVDFHAVGKRGPLIDGAVIFEPRPDFDRSGKNPLVPYKWGISRVATKPDGDLDMKFLVDPSDLMAMFLYGTAPVEFDLQLHRVPPADADPIRAVKDP